MIAKSKTRNSDQKKTASKRSSGSARARPFMLAKKGNAVVDGALILAMIFSVVLVVIILQRSVLDPLNTDIQADSDFSAQAKQISQDSTTRYSSFWDSAIPLLLAFLWAAGIISSQFIDTKPVFFIFSVIGIIVVLMVAMSIEQSYEDTISDSEYSGVELQFPKVHFIMENIVIVIMVIMFSIAVGLYAKG